MVGSSEYVAHHIFVLSGITALLALGILDNIQELGISKPLLEMEHNSAEYLHTLVESLRQVTFFVLCKRSRC